MWCFSCCVIFYLAGFLFNSLFKGKNIVVSLEKHVLSLWFLQLWASQVLSSAHWLFPSFGRTDDVVQVYCIVSTKQQLLHLVSKWTQTITNWRKDRLILGKIKLQLSYYFPPPKRQALFPANAVFIFYLPLMSFSRL